MLCNVNTKVEMPLENTTKKPLALEWFLYCKDYSLALMI